MKKYLLLLCSAATLTIASPAWSEEPAFCVAVMPCDESGELMPEYQDSTSPCFETYRSRCEKFERSLEETGVCRKQNKEIKRLKKQVRLLKRTRTR